MANRALVIGIDHYDPRVGALGGAVRDAIAFAHWVSNFGKVPAGNLRLLLSPVPGQALPALPEAVRGDEAATSRSVRIAMKDLRGAAVGSGDRLYFYYAGHGASIPEWRDDPVLIPPEFVDAELDAGSLLGFRDILPVLGALPFQEQVFLIDACRDFGLSDYEPVIPSAVRPRLKDLTTRQYVLYSVSPGQRAVETGRGVWTSTFLEAFRTRSYQVAVRGRGADGRPRYEVRLDRLADWLRARVAERIEEKFLQDAARYVQTPEYERDPRGGNLLLAEVPRPLAKVEVLVAPDLALETCKIQVMEYLEGSGEEREVKAKGPGVELMTSFELGPTDYSIRAYARRYLLRSTTWTVDDPPQVELTLDVDPSPVPVAAPVEPEATRRGLEGLTDEEGLESLPRSFSLESPVEVPQAAEPGRLTVQAPDPCVLIELLDSRRRLVREQSGSLCDYALRPGIYRVRLRLPGVSAVERTVEVRSGQATEIRLDMPDPKLGRLHLQLLESLGVEIHYEAGGNVEFLEVSETLGPLAGVRFGSLLAFAAYAANQPDTGDFQRLRAFGIAPFPAAALDRGARCGLLVLVGVAAERPSDELQEFLTGCRLVLRRPDGTVVDQSGFQVLDRMRAAAQRLLPLTEPEPLQAELRLPGFGRTRHAVSTLPGRLSVLIAVIEAEGTVDVQQYLLPLPALPGEVPPGWDFLRDSFRNIRRLDLAQRFYAAGELEDILGRSPRQQAEAIYDRLDRFGLAGAREVYGFAAEPVIDVYQQARAAGQDAAAIQALMERKILQIGPRGLGLQGRAGIIEELLWGKWLDPLLGCLAGYALVRTGQAEEFAGRGPGGAPDVLDHLDDPAGAVLAAARKEPPELHPLRNMAVFFTDLPDVHVLAGLCDPVVERRPRHFARALRYGLPVFAEGARALADWRQSVSSPGISEPEGGAGRPTGAEGGRSDPGGALPPLLSEAASSLVRGSPWTAWIPTQPVLLIEDGRFAPPPPSWRILEQHRATIEQTLRSVGRIEIEGNTAIPYAGTGFLAGPNTLITASFVLTTFMEPVRRGTAGEGWRFQDGMRAHVDFREERGEEAQPLEFEITGVVAVDDTHRIAVLSLAPHSGLGAPQPPPLALARRAPAAEVTGRRVYVVGYPAQDPRQDSALMDRAFQAIYGVKRLQPGEILGLSGEEPLFQHDCFTSGGNAGACVVDVETGLVLGLHHSGLPGGFKEATALWRLASSPVFANAGVLWAEPSPVDQGNE